MGKVSRGCVAVTSGEIGQFLETFFGTFFLIQVDSVTNGPL